MLGICDNASRARWAIAILTFYDPFSIINITRINTSTFLHLRFGAVLQGHIFPDQARPMPLDQLKAVGINSAKRRV